MKRPATLIATVALIAACATNPVTGRKQLSLVPESQAISASRQAYVQMLTPLKKEGKLNGDPTLQARLEQITGRLVAQAARIRPETDKWDWTVNVIDDPTTVNAFCMAGGRMAVYTGLIQQVKPTDAELAEVMGHEIAHALSNHVAEKMSVALVTNTAVATLGVMQKNQALLQGAALAAAVAIQLPNSRTQEAEADRIGIELAAKAGYDPHAAVTLWQKMAQLGGGGTPVILSTHPAPASRMEHLKALVPKMMPYYEKAKGGPHPIHQVREGLQQ